MTVDKIISVIRSRDWDKRFNQVYGMPLGGLPLAVRLAYEFKWKLYLPPNGIFPAHVGGRSVQDHMAGDMLIVDDIADTGKTLAPFKMAGYKIVTLFQHPASSVKPDISIEEKPANCWIIFPWAPNDFPEDNPVTKFDCPI